MVSANSLTINTSQIFRHHSYAMNLKICIALIIKLLASPFVNILKQLHYEILDKLL